MTGRLFASRSWRSTVVGSVAVVTVVASVGATVAGAVRPARSRSGRFYRAPSRVSLTAPITITADAFDQPIEIPDARREREVEAPRR
jgi:hypothetical protein